MEKMKRIEVSSHALFEGRCKGLGVNDDNVESEKFSNLAFIDIIGTKDSIEKYLHEDNTKHWFEKEHPNVLNLEFDDISEDEFEYNGIVFKGFTNEQAKKSYDFILANENKDFIICCRAGISRSQAFGNFIHDYFGGYDSASLLDTPNYYVYTKLTREHLKHKGFKLGEIE